MTGIHLRPPSGTSSAASPAPVGVARTIPTKLSTA
jgi:hypothetical protein